MDGWTMDGRTMDGCKAKDKSNNYIVANVHISQSPAAISSCMKAQILMIRFHM